MTQDYSGLLEAITFAAHKHRDQRRKDAAASPYINHPLALAHLLATEGRVRDRRTLIAAVLHDTIEDTETTYEELVDSGWHRVLRTLGDGPRRKLAGTVAILQPQLSDR